MLSKNNNPESRPRFTQECCGTKVILIFQQAMVVNAIHCQPSSRVASNLSTMDTIRTPWISPQRQSPGNLLSDLFEHVGLHPGQELTASHEASAAQVDNTATLDSQTQAFPQLAAFGALQRGIFGSCGLKFESYLCHGNSSWLLSSSYSRSVLR